ncbi:MAG TPA: ornithine cyclodeaminase [Alphaproteobacteria bacterium]|nr:ornithine cyclodeaminase [Alphaproteobacteria bacterium]
MKQLYLDAAAVADLVRATGIESFLKDLARCIEEDYRRWPEFTKSARLAVYYPDGLNELMPTADNKYFAFKFVNAHPKNITKGLSNVVAFGALAETSTGYPLLLSEMTLTTALRTAATSALAAKYMARKNSRTMAIIGNGAQSEFQALAFKALLGIEEIRAFDIDRAATGKLIRNLAPLGNSLRVSAAKSTREAVAGADIVTTETADKARAVILTPEMIAPGMHINAIGGDCPGKTELPPEVLRMATRVVVEYEPQTRHEGDIQQMPRDFPVVELWRVITGAETGRRDDGDITLFDSVGFALEDFSALRCLYDTARVRGIGKQIDLIPELADPRDLYALIKS